MIFRICEFLISSVNTPAGTNTFGVGAAVVAVLAAAGAA
jgi:hypothetical protein